MASCTEPVRDKVCFAFLRILSVLAGCSAALRNRSMPIAHGSAPSFCHGSSPRLSNGLVRDDDASILIYYSLRGCDALQKYASTYTSMTHYGRRSLQTPLPGTAPKADTGCSGVSGSIRTRIRSHFVFLYCLAWASTLLHHVLVKYSNTNYTV